MSDPGTYQRSETSHEYQNYAGSGAQDSGNGMRPAETALSYSCRPRAYADMHALGCFILYSEARLPDEGLKGQR